MPLEKYKQKRDFKQTSEPSGKISHKKQQRFVIQEHHASRLHYDFRLEMDGVLKSWAVPKGPSLDPSVRRLAVQVEDHPVSYIDFEGEIPEGNYGAGKVFVWDSGTYQAEEKNPVKAIEDGKIVVRLKGNKIHGEFHLVKIHDKKVRHDNQWLMIKGDDEYADPQWELQESLPSKSTFTELAKSLEGAKKRAMPKSVDAMLATLVDDIPEGADWLYEMKWDGYRGFCFLEKGNAKLISRNHKPLHFPEIIEDAKPLDVDQVIVDGEIVVLNSSGISSFQLLQNYLNTKNNSQKAVAIYYYIFDLLYLNGYDLRGASLEDRKNLLHQLLQTMPEDSLWRYSHHVSRSDVDAIWQQPVEGVVAKDRGSDYQSRRSRDWLKIKKIQEQEVVICGYTEPRNNRSHFGALILGLYDNNKLQYIGHTGSGFNQQSLKATHELLNPLETSKCPFAKTPKTNEKAHWVKPELVGEVKFSEWTDGDHMRQPIFLGLREDKDPKQCHREIPRPTEKVMKKEITKKTRSKSSSKSSDISDAHEVLQNTDLKGDLEVMADGKNLKLTHLEKEYWPEDHITKGDLLRYYCEASKVLLPYLKDRPLILKRYPNGIDESFFYQHNFEELPSFATGYQDEDEQYIVCNNLATLLYLVNLGTIAQNPFHSRTDIIDRPDYIVFDLDPGDVTYDVVCEVAQNLKNVLSSLKLQAYPKTSGSSGMHVLLPLKRLYSYQQVSDFAMLVAIAVEREIPDLVTVERTIKKRPKKSVYLDTMQNAEGKSAASVWSAREKPGATVSVPLFWSEVKPGLSPKQFTIANALKNTNRNQHDFEKVLSSSQSLGAAMKLLEKKLA